MLLKIDNSYVSSNLPVGYTMPSQAKLLDVPQQEDSVAECEQSLLVQDAEKRRSVKAGLDAQRLPGGGSGRFAVAEVEPAAMGGGVAAMPEKLPDRPMIGYGLESLVCGNEQAACRYA